MATSIRIAQAVGISGAAWLAGNIAALSLIAIPAVSQSHTDKEISSLRLAKQWRTMFNAGKTQNPPIAAAVASSFAYLAWTYRKEAAWSVLRNSPQLYGIAALLTVGVVPFTLGVMMPTNNALLEKAAQSGEGKETFDKEFGGLIEKWQTLNFVRGLLPLFGSALGLVAVLA